MAFIFGYRPEDGARWRGEKVAAEEKAFAASLAASAPAVSSDAKPHRLKKGTLRGGSSVPEIPTEGRPRSPASHMKAMQDHASQYLETKPVSIEHHRKMYYPRIRLGLMKSLGELPDGVAKEHADAVSRLGDQRPPLPTTKAKRWGPLVSDYGRAGDLVEKKWIQRRIQGTMSEPMLGLAKQHIEGIPGRLNPSVDNPGTASCFTGGTTISLRLTSRIPKDRRRDDERQIGLYEDSFRMWRGDYKPPQHGLNTTDVTGEFADAMVTQKALFRA